jgi:hypothetical protein
VVGVVVLVVVVVVVVAVGGVVLVEVVLDAVVGLVVVVGGVAVVVDVLLVKVRSGGVVVVGAVGKYGGNINAVMICSTPLLQVYSLPAMATPATVTSVLFARTKAGSLLFIVRFVMSVRSRMYSAPMNKW